MLQLLAQWLDHCGMKKMVEFDSLRLHGLLRAPLKLNNRTSYAFAESTTSRWKCLRSSDPRTGWAAAGCTCPRSLCCESHRELGITVADRLQEQRLDLSRQSVVSIGGGSSDLRDPPPTLWRLHSTAQVVPSGEGRVLQGPSAAKKGITPFTRYAFSS